jgi:hypothetical protein
MIPHRLVPSRTISRALLGLALLAGGASPGGAPITAAATIDARGPAALDLDAFDAWLQPGVAARPATDHLYRLPPVEVVWQTDGGARRLGAPEPTRPIPFMTPTDR